MVQNTIHYASPVEVIGGFFDALKVKAYDVAFDCLTNDFRNRIWGNDVARFADGYKDIPEIELLAVHEISDDGEKATHDIYYRETKIIYTHPVFDALYQSTLKDPTDTTEKLQNVRTLILELGGKEKNLDETLNRHAFHKDGVAAILWLTDAQDITKDSRFNKELYKTATYRFGMTEHTAEGWKINSLRYNAPAV